MKKIKLLSIFILVLNSHVSVAQSTRDKQIAIQKLLSSARNTSNPNEIADYCDKIHAIDSTVPDQYALLGRINYDYKQYDVALENYNKYLKLNPKGNVYFERSKAYFGLNKLNDAIADAERALNETKDENEYLFYNGFIHMIKGDTTKAELYFDQALKVDPFNLKSNIQILTISLRQKKFEKALKTCNSVINEFNNNPFEKRTGLEELFLLKFNILLYDLHNYNEALIAIDDCIAQAPDRAEFYQLKSLVYFQINKMSECCYYLKEMNRLGMPNPEDFTFDCSKVKAYTPSIDRKNEFESTLLYNKACRIKSQDSITLIKRIDYLNSSLKLNPNNIYAKALRGSTYGYLGFSELSIKDFSDVIQKLPNSPHAYFRRSNIAGENNKIQLALQDAQKAVDLKPNDIENLLLLTLAQLVIGDTTSAYKTNEKCLALDPKNIRSLNDRGFIEGNFKRNNKEAIKYFEMAYSIEENNPFIDKSYSSYADFAFVLDFEGKHKEANMLMEKAISIKPQLGFLYTKLGEIKARNKDLSGACKEWETAFSLGHKEAEEFLHYNCK